MMLLTSKTQIVSRILYLRDCLHGHFCVVRLSPLPHTSRFWPGLAEFLAVTIKTHKGLLFDVLLAPSWPVTHWVARNAIFQNTLS